MTIVSVGMIQMYLLYHCIGPSRYHPKAVAYVTSTVRNVETYQHFCSKLGECTDIYFFHNNLQHNSEDYVNSPS